MPVGIDTSLFVPPQIVTPRTVLVFGRLDPVKRVKECIDVFNRLHADIVAFSATVCGNPTKGNEAYATEVRAAAQTVAGGNIILKSGITNSEAPALYRAHSIYFNLTPSGSFDKTILEAAASGCIPVVVNDMLHEVLPEKLWAHESPFGALAAALVMEEGERAMLVKKLREYVEKEHSLALLVQRILGH